MRHVKRVYPCPGEPLLALINTVIDRSEMILECTSGGRQPRDLHELWPTQIFTTLTSPSNTLINFYRLLVALSISIVFLLHLSQSVIVEQGLALTALSACCYPTERYATCTMLNEVTTKTDTGTGQESLRAEQALTAVFPRKAWSLSGK